MSRTSSLVVLTALLAEAAVILRFGPLAGMVIPFIGVVLNAWFVIHKIGRTGAWTTRGLMKHESTAYERTLQFVGLVLVAGSIILLWSVARIPRAG